MPGPSGSSARSRKLQGSGSLPTLDPSSSRHPQSSHLPTPTSFTFPRTGGKPMVDTPALSTNQQQPKSVTDSQNAAAGSSGKKKKRKRARTSEKPAGPGSTDSTIKTEADASAKWNPDEIHKNLFGSSYASILPKDGTQTTTPSLLSADKASSSSSSSTAHHQPSSAAHQSALVPSVKHKASLAKRDKEIQELKAKLKQAETEAQRAVDVHETRVKELEEEVKQHKKDVEENAKLLTERENHHDAVKEVVNCGICYEVLDDPHVLSCGHTACRRCLIAWFRSKTAYKTELPFEITSATDLSYRTKLCHVCRSSILCRPCRSFTLQSVLDSLGVKHPDPESSQGDPWALTFPPDQPGYMLWDDGEGVHRCPSCLSEIWGNRCDGCELDFSGSSDDGMDEDSIFGDEDDSVFGDEDDDGDNEIYLPPGPLGVGRRLHAAAPIARGFEFLLDLTAAETDVTGSNSEVDEDDGENRSGSSVESVSGEDNSAVDDDLSDGEGEVARPGHNFGLPNLQLFNRGRHQHSPQVEEEEDIDEEDEYGGSFIDDDEIQALTDEEEDEEEDEEDEDDMIRHRRGHRSNGRQRRRRRERDPSIEEDEDDDEEDVEEEEAEELTISEIRRRREARFGPPAVAAVQNDPEDTAPSPPRRRQTTASTIRRPTRIITISDSE